MSKKDYIPIADSLKKYKERVFLQDDINFKILIAELIDIFHKDNLNFNEGQFLNAVYGEDRPIL